MGRHFHPLLALFRPVTSVLALKRPGSHNHFLDNYGSGRCAAKGRHMSERPHHFNPVTVMVDNTVGAILLGILALALLVGLLRSQAQLRRLTTQVGRDESP
jgi:hypothetical protein